MRSAVRTAIASVQWAYTLAVVPMSVCPSALDTSRSSAPASSCRVAKVLSWTTFRRGYFEEYPPPHTVVALELAEGPYFISYPAGIEAAELQEGMPLMLRWDEATDKFGDYNLPVFGPPGG